MYITTAYQECTSCSDITCYKGVDLYIYNIDVINLLFNKKTVIHPHMDIYRYRFALKVLIGKKHNVNNKK